jgi:hypothetical protein
VTARKNILINKAIFKPERANSGRHSTNINHANHR